MTAEPVAVLDLTDEELAVLATTEGAVVFPHLSELPEEAQRVAKDTAYRSLIAHGLLEAPSPSQVQQAEREALGTADGQVAYPVRMAEELARMLTLRAQATMVVCCARTTALGQEYRYAHVVAGVVLLETVTSTGLHRMSLLAEQDLLAHVRTWVLHPEATPGSGEDVIQLVGAGEDPTPPDELLDRLGAALLRADLVVRTADDEGGADLLGVFSGPAGTWSCRTAAGAAGPVVIRPSSPEGVLTELRASLEAVAA